MYRASLLLVVFWAGSSYGTWWGHNHDHNHNHDWGGSSDSGYHMGHRHHHRHGCHHGHDWHHPHDWHFEKLSSSVIEADQYSRSSCKSYSNCNVQEILDIVEYKLVYTMQASDSDNIMVQIKHRVIYMYAKNLNGDDSTNYYDVRVLPLLLKTVDATWTYDGEKLTVTIPYDMSRKYGLKPEDTCVEVNENIINVPRAPAIQYKYGQGGQ